MKTNLIQHLESERQSVQTALDGQKTQLDRNKLGQFSTPIRLANEILEHALALVEETSISFLDPAIGTGAFYSALIQNCKQKKITTALGYDVDPFYAEPAQRLWSETNLNLKIDDFTKQAATTKFNLVICNPPYVRHHHLSNDDKSRLQNLTKKETGITLSGLAGLYSYFVLLSHKWMDENAIAGWLIPSEFMDVNYGTALKEYLLSKVTLLQIHRFNPTNVQFTDALVSSAIIWFKNTPPTKDQTALFTFGGTLPRPQMSKQITLKALEKESKWSRFPLSKERESSDVPKLGDFFEIKRGLATGNNNFFILPEPEIQARNLPASFFKPILPGPRYIKGNIIETEDNGTPITNPKLFLLDTSIEEDIIKDSYPSLWVYLQEGIKQEINRGYICSHRSPWYSQERRMAAPIICTYMGRTLTPNKHPFRFILNKSKATMTNVYLGMYPRKQLLDFLNKEPQILAKICKKFNEISLEEILSEGRVYGGGLHKLEPKELARVPMPFFTELVHRKPPKQIEMAFALVATE
jgi:predicted RNA methylase